MHLLYALSPDQMPIAKVLHINSCSSFTREKASPLKEREREKEGAGISKRRNFVCTLALRVPCGSLLHSAPPGESPQQLGNALDDDDDDDDDDDIPPLPLASSKSTTGFKARSAPRGKNWPR